MKPPPFVQIVAAAISGEDDGYTDLYGLDANGTIWTRAPSGDWCPLAGQNVDSRGNRLEAEK